MSFDADELSSTINTAISTLDLKGCDQQITKAMAIVHEAFSLHAKGESITPDILACKANQIVEEQKNS